jgi:CelD/BcsL family acetyltransferase involved in cellulose biosynthesis
MRVEGKWFDDLEAVAADAAGALDRDAQPLLTDRIDWFRLTRAHLLPDAKPAIVRVRRGGSSVWLFLIETARRRATPLASWYTLRFGPVRHGPEADALLPVLYETLAERFDVVTLHPTSEPPGAMPGWAPYSVPASTNWTIDLPSPDFEAYWADRPATLRNTVARRSRSHPLTVRVHRAFDARAWAEYEDVYRASWKPQEGSFPFLRALAEREGAAGTLRLGVAHDPQGRAVAAQLWLVENGIATIHKLAHREDTKAGSPGSILSHALFREAIAVDEVRRIDFGLGDEPYKADWVDTPNRMWRIDAYRPATIRGATGIARESASRLVRTARHRYLRGQAEDVHDR